MPETLNISGYEIINGESYNNDGSIVTTVQLFVQLLEIEKL